MLVIIVYFATLLFVTIPLGVVLSELCNNYILPWVEKTINSPPHIGFLLYLYCAVCIIAVCAIVHFGVLYMLVGDSLNHVGKSG